MQRTARIRKELQMLEKVFISCYIVIILLERQTKKWKIKQD
jgi:hypothetical protein